MSEKTISQMTPEEFEQLLKEARTEFLLSKAGKKVKYVRKRH